MEEQKTEIRPDYYKLYSVEAVDMARRIWGDEAVMKAAEITAFFYRMRMGYKPENSIQQEMTKERYWLDLAKKIKTEISTRSNHI